MKKSINQSINRGFIAHKRKASNELPRRYSEMHKKSFVPRCLFKYM